MNFIELIIFNVLMLLSLKIFSVDDNNSWFFYLDLILSSILIASLMVLVEKLVFGK